MKLGNLHQNRRPGPVWSLAAVILAGALFSFLILMPVKARVMAETDMDASGPLVPVLNKSELPPAPAPAPVPEKDNSGVKSPLPLVPLTDQTELKTPLSLAPVTENAGPEATPSPIPATEISGSETTLTPVPLMDNSGSETALPLAPVTDPSPVKSPLPQVPATSQPKVKSILPQVPAKDQPKVKSPVPQALKMDQAGEKPTPPAAIEIVVGGIFDFTGPTSMIGRDYAEGASAAAVYINNNGGVDGLSLRLITGDYASKPSKALGLYKTYTENDSVYVILGWGTADARALQEKVTEDQVVYLSSAFDPDLADPTTAPYNFSIGSTYSDHARMAMGWAKENGGKRVSFIYPDHPYGLGPVEAGKEYAQKMGLTIGPDIIVDLRATDVANQLLPLKEFNPEFAWIGGTSPSTEVILNDAARLKLKTKFIINTWGFDENLIKSAGASANGRAMGFIQVRPFGYDVPETARIRSIVGDNAYNLHFNQAWAAMMVIWEGLKRAKKENDLSGPGLKAALETLKDFETGGLTPPLTYTREDHRGTTTCGLYTIQDGKLALVADVHVEREMDYLGW